MSHYTICDISAVLTKESPVCYSSCRLWNISVITMPRICLILTTHWSLRSGGAEYQVRLLMDHLLAKHPDYQRDVMEFIHTDPLASRRQEILACLERAGL